MSDWARWINTGRQLAASALSSAVTAKGGAQSGFGTGSQQPHKDRHPVSVAAEQYAVTVPAPVTVVGDRGVLSTAVAPAAAVPVDQVGAVQPPGDLPQPVEASEPSYDGSGAAPTVPCHYTASHEHVDCAREDCTEKQPHCHHCGAPLTNGAAA